MGCQRLETAAALIAGQVLAVNDDLPFTFGTVLVGKRDMHHAGAERQCRFTALSNSRAGFLANHRSVDDCLIDETLITTTSIEDLGITEYKTLSNYVGIESSRSAHNVRDLPVETPPKDMAIGGYAWQHVSMYTPGFDYENFSYLELGTQARRSWTTDFLFFVYPGD